MIQIEAIVITLFFSGYIWFIFKMLKSILSPEVRDLKLRKSLKIAIFNKEIENMLDVYTLSKGVNNYSNSESNLRQEISGTLKRLNVHLIHQLDKTISEEEKLTIKESIKIVKSLIAENEKITPFSELPTHERMVIEDAKAYLENKDSKSVERKISELANFLIVANDRKNKSERQTKLSLILAVISILVSLILAFF